ncbi:hypothetical protein VTN96DRAFT_10163 [Rasamsonia emersonii]|uniref:Enoyl-CoA hydratase n=1 Tax=Rasamsonia emersonii (strain ATCC 16479 / CBS 393.64 / IMI 116815) TaxID=1408163 RepID=A0A0F4Z0W7_RASE3|nr:Enoyl-CoA hydratase [Rasamsonia emersonii CBS 393.64]KKA24134.1 Enoyl-CoA hydratase [Rasamsonia emersonii CBS 393.64]
MSSNSPPGLPSSYTALPTKYIALSHVPAESPTPTKVIVVTLNRPGKNAFSTGSIYPASHPLLSTLFSEVLPTPEATVARALELTKEIAENTSTVATALMRDLMYQGPDSAEAMHLLDSRVIFDLFGGRDNREGVQSLLEKRKPEFQANFSNADDVPGIYPWWTQLT